MNSPNDKNSPKIRRRFYFERAQGVALAAMFVVSTGVIFYLSILTGENIQKRANAFVEKPLARILVVAPLAEQPAIDPAPQSISAITPANGAINGKAALVAVKLEVPLPSLASSPTSPPAQMGTGNENVAHRNGAATMSKNVAVAPAPRAVDGGKP